MFMKYRITALDDIHTSVSFSENGAEEQKQLLRDQSLDVFGVSQIWSIQPREIHSNPEQLLNTRDEAVVGRCAKIQKLSQDHP